MNVKNIIQLKNSSWLLPGPTNVGIFTDCDCGAYLIDTGCDHESGKLLLRAVKQKEWQVRAIINTHSNADHMGANNFIQQATGCEIWATKEEAAFIESPLLEESFFYGGLPFSDLRRRFYAARPSKVTRILTPDQTHENFRFISLPGHFFNMVGVITSDDIFYTADALFDEYVLNKYKIPYLLDVRAFKETLYKIKNIRAELYVPSHGEFLTDIEPLANYNAFRVEEIEEKLLEILKESLSFDDIAQRLCRSFELSLTYSQFLVICSTIRSFLSYLVDSKKISHSMSDNKMLWEAVK